MSKETVQWPEQRVRVLQLRDRIALDDSQDEFLAKAQVYVELLDNPGTMPDPTPDMPDPDDFNNPTNRPGRCEYHHTFCHQ